jgi:cytochrome c551/c552
MPASDEYFFGLKRLHAIFAVSAAALLATTVWFIGDDHNRSWKDYQREYREIDSRLSQWEAVQRLTDEEVARYEESADPDAPSWFHSEYPGLGKKWLELPIADAFNSPLEVKQIWLPEVTQNLHHAQTARIDRCVTCHVGIDRTTSRSSEEPFIAPEQVLQLLLDAPTIALSNTSDEPADDAATVEPTLENTFGFSLTAQGLVDPSVPTVRWIAPDSPAANAYLPADPLTEEQTGERIRDTLATGKWPNRIPRAVGLKLGDAITEVNGKPVASVSEIEKTLLEDGGTQEPIRVTIQRGLAAPLASHPRIDLFVGASSPHPIDEFGCTICHEGQGSATSFEWASHTPNDPEQTAKWRADLDWFDNRHWEYPMLPDRFVEASCLKCHRDIDTLRIRETQPDPPAAKLVEGRDLVHSLGCVGCHETGTSTPHPRIGPSLRRIDEKLEIGAIARWIADPHEIRPNTKMPRSFGLMDHLTERGKADAKRFETIEIRGIAEYLHAVAEPSDSTIDKSTTGSEGAIARGKNLFELRGCVACHRHEGFPAVDSDFGPDLSNLDQLLSGEKGSRWLVGWLKDPHRHDPDTRMPNPKLGTSTDADGNATDDAIDLAAYLLRTDGADPAHVQQIDANALDELVLAHLTKRYDRETAQRHLELGIPGAEPNQTIPPTIQNKLRYVGERAIAQRGCFGCHDIPGFENAKPIGVPLTDWGRKPEHQLAFGYINEYLADQDIEPFHRQAIEQHKRHGFLAQKLREPRSFDHRLMAEKPFTDGLRMPQFELTNQQREAITTFVLGLVDDKIPPHYQATISGRARIVADGERLLKKHNCTACHLMQLERWELAFESGEVIVPWSDPALPAADLDFSDDVLAASEDEDTDGLLRATIVGMPMVDDFDGGPAVLSEDEDPLEADEAYDPGSVYLLFQLWRNAAIEGQLVRSGAAPLMIPGRALLRKQPALGGEQMRRLMPRVFRQKQESGELARGGEAWEYLPPPLFGLGAKVRQDWLVDYLQNPTPIRPKSVMRMPHFNLSREDAIALAKYFALLSEVDPHEPSSARTDGQLAAADEAYREHLKATLPDTPAPHGVRLEHAMKIVTDQVRGCVKCHQLGAAGEKPLGPNLELAYKRLRPEFVRRWIAKPDRIAPYTSMLDNLRYQPDDPERDGFMVDYYHGTSSEQLEALVDLLMRLDHFSIRRQTSPPADTSAPSTVDE